MSVKHIGLVLDHLKAPAQIKLVAVILADHADADGYCFPSYRKIAQRACQSERTVRRHVQTLLNLGVVKKVRTGTVIKAEGKAIRVSNAYKFNTQAIMETAEKLSTDGPVDKSEFVHLEVVSRVKNRWTSVATKSSVNHKDINHKSCGNVDNSGNAVTLDQALGKLFG